MGSVHAYCIAQPGPRISPRPYSVTTSKRIPGQQVEIAPFLETKEAGLFARSGLSELLKELEREWGAWWLLVCVLAQVTLRFARLCVGGVPGN